MVCHVDILVGVHVHVVELPIPHGVPELDLGVGVVGAAGDGHVLGEAVAGGGQGVAHVARAAVKTLVENRSVSTKSRHETPYRESHYDWPNGCISHSCGERPIIIRPSVLNHKHESKCL